MRLLIERLRDVAGTVPFQGSGVKDRDPDAVIPKTSRKEQALVDYISTVAPVISVSPQGGVAPVLDVDLCNSIMILCQATDFQRPSTALSRPATASSSRPPSSLASINNSNSHPLNSGGPGGTTFSSRPGTAASSRPSTGGIAGGGGGGGPDSSGGGSSGGRADPRSVIKSVQGQLNIWEIDAVKEMLSRELREEHSALLEDIEYLQGLLEEETDLQVTD